VTKGEKLTEFDAIQWSFTIADLRLDSPERYVADVKRWAECLLKDTAGIGLA
jgi:hypothetical protein